MVIIGYNEVTFETNPTPWEAVGIALMNASMIRIINVSTSTKREPSFSLEGCEQVAGDILTLEMICAT